MDIGSLFGLAGKVALVTGGSRGIGAMIAEGLVSAGVTTYIAARKREELEQTAARLGAFGTCIPVAADLSTEAGIAALAETIATREGKLHILVNNAGVSWGEELDAFPRIGFEKVLNINVTGPFELTQRLLPQLRAGASMDDPARVINIASIDGIRPPSRETYSYSASKAGVIMLTRHLAKRLAEEQITVNVVAPGLFPSKMTDFIFDESHPRHEVMPEFPLGGRPGRPEDIAGTVIYLASRAGSYVTGVTIPVSGGRATAE